jgi:hypothetical protein
MFEKFPKTSVRLIFEKMRGLGQLQICMDASLGFGKEISKKHSPTRQPLRAEYTEKI